MTIKTFFSSLERKIKKLCAQFAYISFSKKKGINDKENCDFLELERLCKRHSNELDISVCPVFLNKKGIVTIISDDGDFDTGKTFDELCNKYEIPVTIAGAVYNIFPHINEWKEILKNNYIELINHSYNHFRMDEDWKHAKSKLWLKHELVHSQMFIDKYFQTNSSVFVCPHNIICQRGLYILKDRGVIAMRGYGPDLNPLIIKDGEEKGEWLNLNSVGIMDQPKDGVSRKEMRKNWLEETTNGKWLIEMWHSIDSPGFQTITLQDAEYHFKEICQYRDERELWCANFSDAVKYIKEKSECNLFSWIEGSELKIVAIYKDWKQFQNFHPLSVILSDKSIVLEKSENVLKSKNENDEIVYILNIIPNHLEIFKIKEE